MFRVLGVQGLGFRVLGFRISGFRVWGFRAERVLDLDLGLGVFKLAVYLHSRWGARRSACSVHVRSCT